MILRLSLLDRQTSFKYTEIVGVYLASGKNYEHIGTCRFFTDETGHHFGELKLEREVDSDFYFYYRNRVNNNGDIWFDGLDLMEEELQASPTTRLREMVVSQ